jgi:PTS system glucitol/sorbitol-specific IIC component
MDVLANFAQAFHRLVFKEGGKTFLGLAGGILPTLITLMTAVNALIKFVGQERINNIAQIAGRHTMLLRYTVMPVLAVFLFNKPYGLYLSGVFYQKNTNLLFMTLPFPLFIRS